MLQLLERQGHRDWCSVWYRQSRDTGIGFLFPMSYTPHQERQCPCCESTRVRPMTPRAYEAASLVTWYECLRCPHIWYRDKIVTSWTAQSPERRQSPRAGYPNEAKTGKAFSDAPSGQTSLVKRLGARPSGVVGKISKTDKGHSPR